MMWYPLRLVIPFFPLRLVYGIGCAGGHLLYLLSKENQVLMTDEFLSVFPEKTEHEIKILVKKAFCNYCISEIEILLYPMLNKDRINRFIRITGLEHLDAALAHNKGVLLFQAHFGAFQMVMPTIGYNGYVMNQISASASEWKADDLSSIQKKSVDIKAGYEYTLPVKHIPIRSTMRPVFRALARNEIVGITVDGGGGAKTQSLKFLNRDANFQQGAVDLALRTGARVVPAFILTHKGLAHTLIIHPPLNISNAAKKETAIRNMLDEFITVLEPYVRQHPDHYGYTLSLRKSRAATDPYPFFEDYRIT